VLRVTAAVLVVAVAVGCGASVPPPTERQWVANARGVTGQLRNDVAAVSGFDRLPQARVGLSDESQLYGLLVSYTDFAGCRHMVTEVGAVPPRLAGVVTLLHRACLQLERADGLFTRAVAHEAPGLLIGATREAVAAGPFLYQAALKLAQHE
jgi:hypothetical protein